MQLDRRISLVTLGVEDIVRATEFYRRLGWTKSSASQESVTFMQLKSLVLGLFSRQSLAEDAGVENTRPGFSGVALAQNLASEKEVDEAFEFAVSCGAKAVKKPEKVFWGGYSGYFADPDGHLWELAYNPFFPMDEQGHIQLPE